MKFNGAGSSLLDLHEMRATRLSFDVQFEMEPSAHMVVTDKFEMRSGRNADRRLDQLPGFECPP